MSDDERDLDHAATADEESRAKADPDSGLGPGDRPGAEGDEFTDPGAQPPP